MLSGKRRKYTPEFREQAARLVIETGRPVQVLVGIQKSSAASDDRGPGTTNVRGCRAVVATARPGIVARGTRCGAPRPRA
jgi:hypothetical protein